MSTPKLNLSVSVAGVVVAIDIEPHATVADVIKKVLAQSFTPESCPDEKACGLALQVGELDRESKVGELPLNDGAMLNLTLPF